MEPKTPGTTKNNTGNHQQIHFGPKIFVSVQKINAGAILITADDEASVSQSIPYEYDHVQFLRIYRTLVI
jgi:hypothetical protein